MQSDQIRSRRTKLLEVVGPGVITGAADDDPSGIATYAQAGARFGYNMLWATVVAYPLLVAIQSVVACIGRVTGRGLAANARLIFPGWVVAILVLALLVANTVNIAADLSAMAEALRTVVPEPIPHAYTIGLALLSLGLEVFLPYKRYVPILKWLTLALLAYVAVAFVVHIPWVEVARRTIMPQLTWNTATITMIVAVFGTTISPYLFFWQSSQEVEEIQVDKGEAALVEHPAEAPEALSRIRLDTVIGLGFATVVAFFIKLTTAATLHAHGVTDITTAAQAATALRPIAGDFAFALFAIGILGTGLLAVPVLAGASAYAVADAMGWKSGLSFKFREATGFYSVMAVATLVGVGFEFARIDPIQALVGAAVINGLIAPVIMVAAMMIASRRKVMGDFTASPVQKLFGWLATAVMTAAAVALFVVR